jgi:hypothetical protein
VGFTYELLEFKVAEQARSSAERIGQKGASERMVKILL